MADYVSRIAPTPNRTIGCQDLLKDGACVHSGWLRRQSLRNRLKIFAWAQVYVVVSGGCVYCYSNEVSRRPASTFSLYGYDKVFRAGEITSKEATWVFKLVHVNADFRSYLFSCSSEKEMLYWMKIFKQEMLRANGKLPRLEGDGWSSDTYQYQDAGSRSDGSITSQDYTDIEANIYEDSRMFVMPTNYNNKKEAEDSDDEMDTVVKRTLRDPRDRPPQPPPVPDRTTKMMTKTMSSNSLNSSGGDFSSSGDFSSTGLGGSKGATSRSRDLPALPTSSTSSSKGSSGSRTAATATATGQGAAAIIAGLQKQAGTQFYSEATPPLTASRTIKEEEQTSSHEWRRGSPDGSSVKKRTENKTQYEKSDVDDFWSSIYFYDGRDKASEIIRQIQDEGVYLVRVNDDGSMVLHLFGDGQSRKFQIFQENGRYTLQKTSGNYFDTVAELIYFYYMNTLPNLKVCLTECFRYHENYPNLQFS